MITVYIILGLAAVCAVTGFILSTQIKRAKKAEAQMEELRDLYWEMAARAEKLRTAVRENAKAEEEADGKRRELDQTPDSGLADRANALFGVRDRQSGNNGGN
jgi:hypothetical protein